jgi:hypothetical protein
MSTFFTHSDHMPCAECGASVSVAEKESHVCDPERLLDFRMFQLRDEIAALEEGVSRYLDSSAGLFAQWLAEHERPPV